MEKIGNKLNSTEKLNDMENLDAGSAAENQNKGKSAEKAKKKFEFTKENINNGSKRQAIIDYLNGEVASQLKQQVGLGRIDDVTAKRQLLATQTRLKELNRDYNADHNDEAFLYVVNQMMENGVRQSAESIDRDDPRTEKLENTEKIRESIIARNKKGEITNSLMDHKLKSLDKVVEKINEDFDVRRYGVYAERMMRDEDKLYTEAAEKYDQKEDEFIKKRREFEAGGEKIAEKQQEELDKLREEMNTLWGERAEAGKNAYGTDEERRLKKVKEIVEEEKAKEEARKERLARALDVSSDWIDGREVAEKAESGAEDDTVNKTVGSGHEKVEMGDIDASMDPANFMRFMRTGVAARRGRNGEVLQASKERELEVERQKQINQFYESMRPNLGDQEKAFKEGESLFDSLVEGDNNEEKAQILNNIAKRREQLNGANEEERRNPQHLMDERIQVAIDLVIRNGSLANIDELKTKFGENAAYAYVYRGIFEAKNKLLALYNPKMAAEAAAMASGKSFDADNYKSPWGSWMSEEQYIAARYALYGFEKKMLETVMNKNGLGSYVEAKDKLSDFKQGEEYRSLLAEQRQRKLAEERARVEKAKVKPEKKEVERAEPINPEFAAKLRGRREKEKFAEDYVRSFFDKNSARRMGDYLNGKDIYDDTDKAGELPGRSAQEREENREDIVKLINQMDLWSIFKGSSRELAGKDQLFEASYVYTELEEEFLKCKQQIEAREFRRLPEEEQERLSDKSLMLQHMMSGFLTYYSERFNVSNDGLRLRLLGNIRNSVANRARRLFRNIIRRR